MTAPIIKVESLTKQFKHCTSRNTTLKDWIVYRKKYHENETRYILDNISFSLEKGKSLGIMGINGSGKSTLLKILAKIYAPTKGTVTIHGKVASLIELGAGFHPEMTGRENIFVNASINGLSPNEISKKINEIINFSELGEFIDKPIKIYSSGMYMRLAFSIAIHADADVLLVDEILAVGDLKFQKKCFDKLAEIKKKGTSIVLISHSPGQIIENCDVAIWLNEGKIEYMGLPSDVANAYLLFVSGE